MGFDQKEYNRQYYQRRRDVLLQRQKDYYQEHKETIKPRIAAYQKAKYADARAALIDVCGGRCLDCGNDNPVVLQFHHRDPTLKEFEISGHHTVKPMEQLQDELDKCDLVCANCHLIRHFKG